MLPVLMATNTYDSEGAEDFVDDIMTLILVAVSLKTQPNYAEYINL